MGEGPTISTHVLDAEHGRPMQGVLVQVTRMNEDALGDSASGVTDDDGRITGLTDGPLEAGTYLVTFHLDGPFFRQVSLTIVVDDAPAGSGQNRVLDVDLQVLVNGLWQAGAEAVQINDQRITNLTAIREAGQAPESVALTEHHHLGLPDIQRAVGVGELFDTMLVTENFPFAGRGAMPVAPGLELSGVRITDATHYPLTVVVIPDDEITVGLGYQPHAFDEQTVRDYGRWLLTLLTELVADPSRPVGRVPIVGVSGRGNAADEAAARAAGMNGYLAKPLSPSALTRVLGSVVPPEA